MRLSILKEISIVLALLFISCVLYLLSGHFAYYKRLNDKGLSSTTSSILMSFDKPITITLHSPSSDMHQKIKLLIESYQQLQPQIHFQWLRITPQTKLPQHALVIQFNKNEQIIDLEKTTLNENALTNALFKLQRKPNEWVVILQGHGEPSLYGTEPRDFNLFRQALENQGLKVQALNLSQTPFIPDNASVLIIASPQSAFLPIEEKLILDYLSSGKDLLWLTDPNDYNNKPMSDYLGILPQEGTIADLHGHHLGTPHPAITIIDSYADLPFEAPLSLTAFPFAKALLSRPQADFSYHPFLRTHADTWTEKNINDTSLSFEPEKNEIAGPLTLGYLLTKAFPNSEQRIIVIGNSRFLSNGAIENYGNLALGMNFVSWLHHDDQLLNISSPVVKDSMLHLPFISIIAITYGFPLLSIALCICAILFFKLRTKRSNQSQRLGNPSRINSF